ncbi:MAG: tetratricopeptide repeat protein [Crocosphaera sp.]|nr:tetratricopeptide repeat protein [Crocosphaera sp.]
MLILLSLILGFLGLRLSFSTVSTWYMNWGWEHYKKGDLSRAKENYQRALSLNSNNIEINFRLGLLYENLQQFKSAETQYLLAMQGGNQTAINNLARLYILNKNNAAAVSLINNARARFDTFSLDTEYALLKNLGWARFNQEAYDEARFHLDQAFNLLPKTSSDNQNRADIYCLLAQVQEKQGEDAMENWNQCNAKANSIYPEEDQWRRLAQQRIKKMLTEKSSQP